MVLGAGIGRTDGGHAPGGAVQPSPQAARIQLLRKVDRAADGVDSPGDEVELRAQPVRGDEGVGVGRGDEPAVAPGGEERPRGEVHPELACDADALAAPLQRAQAQPRMRGRGLGGHLLGGVRARVEDEQHLVGRGIDAGLRRQRGQAGADRRLLVARGHDDAGLERHEADRGGHPPASAAIRAVPSS